MRRSEAEWHAIGEHVMSLIDPEDHVEFTEFVEPQVSRYLDDNDRYELVAEFLHKKGKLVQVTGLVVKR